MEAAWCWWLGEWEWESGRGGVRSREWFWKAPSGGTRKKKHHKAHQRQFKNISQDVKVLYWGTAESLRACLELEQRRWNSLFANLSLKPAASLWGHARIQIGTETEVFGSIPPHLSPIAQSFPHLVSFSCVSSPDSHSEKRWSSVGSSLKDKTSGRWFISKNVQPVTD